MAVETGVMETFEYDNRIVRKFALATIIWGVVGMLVGVVIAVLLYVPDLLGHFPFLSFGRLRPVSSPRRAQGCWRSRRRCRWGMSSTGPAR